MYTATVREVVDEIVPLRRNHSSSYALLEPVLYTHERRRNLLRAAFSIASGRTVGYSQDGLIAAAIGELAWTCALILDDIIDESTERDGHAAAHITFGRAHALASVVATLCRIAHYLATTPRAPLPVRLTMGHFATRVLAASSLAAFASPRRTRDPACYMTFARCVNACTHWAVLAPLLRTKTAQIVAPAWRYADAASRNGKLRNDLLDYCGGSTESDTRYKDFHQRLVTFPVIALLQTTLAPGDRQAVVTHFYTKRRSDLAIDRFLLLLSTTNALSRYLAVMTREASIVERAATAIDDACGEDPPLSQLMRSWTYCVLTASHQAAQHLCVPLES